MNLRLPNKNGESGAEDIEVNQHSKTQVSLRKLPAPKASIDKIIDIWNEILPQRIIEFKDDKVIVRLGGSSYPGSEMSDGFIRTMSYSC